MPLLLAVGMTGESAGAFQQVIRSKIGKPSLLRINELLASNRTGKLDDGSWLLSDPSALASAPPASEDPTGLASALSGSRYYVYRGRDGNLHELRFDDSWHHRDLSAAISETPSRLP